MRNQAATHDRNRQSKKHHDGRSAGCETNPSVSLTTLQRIVRVFRDWTSRLRGAFTTRPPRKPKSQETKLSHLDRERLAHEYSQGYMAGWRECFETCLRAVEDEIATAEDVWHMGAVLTGSRNIQRDN